MTAVLGIKCGPQHDTGAALVYESDGQLKCVAISEERLLRDKQCRKFPALSIKACLADVGIGLTDLDLVCVDKLGPKTMTETDRELASIAPDTWSPLEKEFFESLDAKPVRIVNHHLAHAATAFCVQPMADTACLIIDGSGSDYPLDESPHRLIAMGAPDAQDDFPMSFYERRAETQSIFHGTRKPDGSVSLERKSTSTRSGIGHFYSFFSRHSLGFGHLQEGKAMGLAAWGNSQMASRFPTFDNAYSGIDTLLMDQLKEEEFQYSKRKESPPTDPLFASTALWMQNSLNQAVLHLAETALTQTGSRNLCMAGGVALNVVANRMVRERLRSSKQLDGMFVQPAASDAGMPLGAALYGYYIIRGGKLPFQENLVYLGPSHDPGLAESIVVKNGGSISNNIIKETADLLLDEKIVGWWQGRSEYGPRALGSRSILCWPRPEGMKDHLNLRVKHREAFRPFAPIVREEQASKIFDNDFPVPYMLFNTQIKPEYLDKIPAVTHVDGSGRLQTVTAQFTPLLYELLGEVQERDDVGVLLNTSFNDAGEPIVETVEDALSCFERTGLDALVCGNAILRRS